MASNKDLGKAQREKKAEFYTQLTDIEKEMRYYRPYFRDKIVFCNCDDPFESNFFKYFVMSFNRLHLKQLICTCYAGSPVMGKQITFADILNKPDTPSDKPYKAIVNKVYDITGDGAIDHDDIVELFRAGENTLEELNGDGDFRSDECVELLQQSDIVVTNPPFPLFREYVAQLVEYDKKFIILGNQNAITYKEFFPLIQQNKVWIGASIHSGDRAFYVPDDYPLNAAGCGIDEKTGRKYIRVKGVRWWTNLDLHQRHEEMILVNKYDPEQYPKYVNYDAIHVKTTDSIPRDYDGVMGVPITFLDRYNPDQFELIGLSLMLAKPMNDLFPRGAYQPGGRAFYSPTPTEKDRLKGYKYHREFARLAIRNKHPEMR